MHSSQYTAVARWADEQGCEVHAMEFLPGAMQHADGAYVVLYNDSNVGGRSDFGRAFCLVSLHVETVPHQRGGEPAVHDLQCGDRTWTDKITAIRALADRVIEDEQEFAAGA